MTIINIYFSFFVFLSISFSLLFFMSILFFGCLIHFKTVFCLFSLSSVPSAKFALLLSSPEYIAYFHLLLFTHLSIYLFVSHFQISTYFPSFRSLFSPFFPRLYFFSLLSFFRFRFFRFLIAHLFYSMLVLSFLIIRSVCFTNLHFLMLLLAFFSFILFIVLAYFLLPFFSYFCIISLFLSLF